MSTVIRVNFEPVRNVMPIQVADFPLTDPTLSNPQNPAVLVDGEWMSIGASYRMARAASIAMVDTEAAAQSYPLWAQRGATDVQAIANRKMPILWLGSWEFDTRIYDAAATPGAGAAITAVNQAVKVASITIGSRIYCGLVGHGGSMDTAVKVGFVTRLPADNGGRLRIRGGMLF